MYDCIIIGAGPAGLMCASHLNNQQVILIEKKNKPGNKLLLTGGGRCNITNLKEPNDFLSYIYNHKYMYQVINMLSPRDIYNYFEHNNVPLKEEKDNKIFPISNKAEDILNVLKKNNPYEIKTNEKVEKIIKKEDFYEIKTNKSTYLSKKVIIATGGASYKQTGSSGDHYQFALDLNQKVNPLVPKECGIILKEKLDLEGTSLNDVSITYNKKIYSGNFIITKNGLSGEAIMNLSRDLNLKMQDQITIDLYPLKDENEIENDIHNYDKNKEINSYLNNLFTKKFTKYLLNKLNLENRKISTLNKTEIKNIITLIKKYPFIIKSLEDLAKAYVTGGGIDLSGINSKTMESKINKNLYFIGETLDVDGPIGGYNLTLALATGYAAALAINKEKEKL